MSQCLELSFVKDRVGGGRNFWSVDHSGTYREQWRRGQLLALEALDFMAEDDRMGRWLLGRISGDMQQHEDGKGVELGFMNCIGEFATLGLAIMGDEFYRQRMADGDAAHIAALADEKAKRSERARNAAQARWAKARARQPAA